MNQDSAALSDRRRESDTATTTSSTAATSCEAEPSNTTTTTTTNNNNKPHQEQQHQQPPKSTAPTTRKPFAPSPQYHRHGPAAAVAAAHKTRPALPGDVVGPYIIEAEIGRGQFAAVYRARRCHNAEHHHNLRQQAINDLTAATIDALTVHNDPPTTASTPTGTPLRPPSVPLPEEVVALKIDLVPERCLGGSQRADEARSIEQWKRVVSSPDFRRTPAGKQNVIKVFETDLHTAWGHRCVALELFEGGDLRSVLKQAVARNASRAEKKMKKVTAAAAAATNNTDQLSIYAHHQQHRNYEVFGLSERNVRAVVYQVLRALEACHREGVCHRDIKPANILHNGQGQVKLCDFGLSVVQATGELTVSSAGSPAYMPREAFGFSSADDNNDNDNDNDSKEKKQTKKEKQNNDDTTPTTTTTTTTTTNTHDNNNDNQPPKTTTTTAKAKGYDAKAADIWAVGVTMYQLLVGRRPFDGATLPQLIRAIRAGVVSLPASLPLSPDALDFMTRLLWLDPAGRPTAKQALEHKWFLRQI